MKHIFRILLFLLITLAGFAPLKAQWEQIGWEGGGIQIAGQLENTLYGVANYSIYKSIDWGKTWVMFKDGLPVNTIFYKYLRMFNRDGFLYLDFSYASKSQPGFFESGLFYCKESDNKWRFKKLSLIKGIMPNTLFWSSDTVVGYRGGGDPNPDSFDGFYFSNDGGNSWTRRMNGIYLNNYHGGSSMGTIFLINLGRNILRTTDFGITWKKISMGKGDSLDYFLRTIKDSIFLMRITHIFPPDFSPNSEFYRSADFGTTWTKLPNPLSDLASIGNVGMIKTVGKRTFMAANLTYLNSMFFVSNDLGEHWKRILFQDSNTSSFDIFGTDSLYVGYIYNLNSNLSRLYSMDSFFISLTTTPPPIGILANSRKLVCVSGTKLFALPNSDPYASDLYDSILVSNNNGTTWTKHLFFGQNKLFHNKWVIDGSKLYASGMAQDSQSCIFCSTDNGDSWAIITKFSLNLDISNFFVSGDTIVAAFNVGLYLSIDKGNSWIVESDHSIDYSMKVAYKDGILVTLNNYQGSVNYSLDFGAHWTSKVSFDNTFTKGYGLYIFDGRWLISTGKNGYPVQYQLEYTKAQDSVWKECKGLDSNLFSIPTCNENGILYTTGSGEGVNPSYEGRTALYYSLDSGANWKQLGDYVTNSPDVFIGSDYIFLAGPTELWRGPKPTIPSGVSPAKTTSSISINECYPNPAASELRISYTIPKHSDVVLSIFDMTGKKLTTIANEAHEGGSYEKLWNVKSLPSGSYILKLTACGESVTKVVEVVR